MTPDIEVGDIVKLKPETDECWNNALVSPTVPKLTDMHWKTDGEHLVNSLILDTNGIKYALFNLYSSTMYPLSCLDLVKKGNSKELLRLNLLSTEIMGWKIVKDLDLWSVESPETIYKYEVMETMGPDNALGFPPSQMSLFLSNKD